MGAPNISSSVFDESYSNPEYYCEFRSRFNSEVVRGLEVPDAEGKTGEKERSSETTVAAVARNDGLPVAKQ